MYVVYMQKTLWFLVLGKVEVGQGSLKKWTGLHPNSYFEITTKEGRTNLHQDLSNEGSNFILNPL